MTRIAGWEARLKAVITKHQSLPSEYGVSDCFIICDDAVEALTGDKLFPDLASYDSEFSSAKVMVGLGFKSVEEMFASKLEEIPVSLAQRGDIGVMLNVNNELCGGVFTSLGFMARSLDSVLFLPVTSAKTAFKVGR